MNLSKSLYIRGLQCSKSLWLKKYKSNVLTPLDEQAKAVFEVGDKVGALACQLFPEGKKIPFEGTTFDEKMALTQQYIDEGIKNIYEATFKYDDVLVMVDILHINDDGSVEIYEVKSSTWNSEKTLNKIKKYIDDASIQHYVVSGCGFEIKKTSIVLLNGDYVRGEELEIEQLFSIVDVMDEVVGLQDDIPTYLSHFQKVLNNKEVEPDIDIGWHCKNPYECDAYEYCWKTQREIPEYSVFDIFPLTKNSKALQLYHQGIVEVNDIPDDFELTEKQALAVNAWKYQRMHIDTDEIKNFLDSLTYPIYHLDFETYQNAIPEFSRQSPYQQICFQYSLHIEPEVGKVEHREFLGKEGTDPRVELIEKMISDIEHNSTILVYNDSFEKPRIREMAQDFPKYANELMKIHDNILDLAIPFKNKAYYDYQLKGKHSIKLVMPLLVPHMAQAYNELKLVQNGGDAMNTFPKLVDMDEQTKGKYREALLKYCELDTLAMMETLKKLREVMK